MLVTCDSFKLAKCVRTTDIGNENRDKEDVSFLFIIPNKTVNELYKLLVSDDEDAIVKIYYMRKYIIVELNGITFFSRLVEGEYIDFNRIIIKNHTVKISMDKEDLLSALERAALVTEEKIAGSLRSHVKLIFEGNLLKITANSSAGSTYDEIEINDIGAPLTIGFNNRYLINSVRACNSERIRLSLSSNLSSLNIVPAEAKEGIEEVFMLLPVRLKD
jgi:DNA polymerase-3 subunit beta